MFNRKHLVLIAMTLCALCALLMPHSHAQSVTNPYDPPSPLVDTATAVEFRNLPNCTKVILPVGTMFTLDRLADGRIQITFPHKAPFTSLAPQGKFAPQSPFMPVNPGKASEVTTSPALSDPAAIPKSGSSIKAQP